MIFRLRNNNQYQKGIICMKSLLLSVDLLSIINILFQMYLNELKQFSFIFAYNTLFPQTDWISSQELERSTILIFVIFFANFVKLTISSRNWNQLIFHNCFPYHSLIVTSYQLYDLSSYFRSWKNCHWHLQWGNLKSVTTQVKYRIDWGI